MYSHGFKFCVAFSVMLTACGSAPTKLITKTVNIPMVPAHPTEQQLQATLQKAEFQTYDGPFHGRTPAPDISSLEQNPALALGTVFVKEALPTPEGKPGSCSAKSPTAFTYERLLDLRKQDGCKVHIFPGRTLVSKKVSGEDSADLKYVVGSLAGNAKYAFEFFITEPMTAAFEETSACLDAVQAAQTALPQNACEAFWIAGAVLTQVAYRTYTQFDGQTSNGFGLVQIGGKAYSANENVDNKFFLTVDMIPLKQYFAQDEKTGYLITKPKAPDVQRVVSNTKAEPEKTVAAIKATLDPTDKAILQASGRALSESLQ